MTQRTADRLMQATTVTSTATVTLGAAWSGGFQTLAQAMAATAGKPEAIATGQRMEFTVLDPATFAWETSVYVITDAVTLTRLYVVSSSNGGLPVAFAAGTKQVIGVVSSARLVVGMVDQDDVGFDIVLCIGQSNMSNNPTSDPLIDTNDPRIFQWSTPLGDATRHQILSATEPLYMPNGPTTGKTGLATWFARAYADTIPTNRKVLLVPCASGSTGLVNSYWQPGSPGGQGYELAISEANLAIAAALQRYPNSRYVGAIWAQGEADGVSSSNPVPQWQYATALKAMIAGLRSRVSGAANSWFVIFSMTPEGMINHPGEVGIDLAHKQVAAEVDRVVFVPPISGMAADVHWTAPGVRIMGPRGGLAVAAAKRSVGVDSMPPAIVAASVSNSSPSMVTLTFSELLDASSTPTAAALASSIAGHTVSSVAISGNSATLGLTAPLVGGEARNFVYAKPASNFFKDLAGNALADGATFAITNNVSSGDTTAPTLVSAVISDALPAAIVLTFSEPLAAGNPPLSTITVTGSQTSVTSVAVNGPTVTLSMAGTYSAGQAANVTIQPNGTNDLQDPSGNKVGALGPIAVTNNIASAGSGTTTYATLSASDHNAGITISGGNLIATATAAGFIAARGSSGKTSGVLQFEATMTAGTSGVVGLGIASTPLNTFPGGDNPAAASMGYYSAGQRYVSNGNVGALAAFTTNDVIGVVANFTAQTIEFLKNGVSQGSFAMPSGMVSALASGGAVFPMVATNGSGVAFKVTMGAPAFANPKAGATGWSA